MSAPRTVAAVLDRLDKWARLGGTDIRKALDLLFPDADDDSARMEIARRLNVAASREGYRDASDAARRGGLPAVRAMIARAREGAGGR